MGDGTKLVSIPAPWAVTVCALVPKSVPAVQSRERVPWVQLGALSSVSESNTALPWRLRSSCCPQVCYCRRHQPQQQPPSMPAGAQAGRQSSRLAAETRPSPESSRRLDGDAADSSRCRSFNHALRRGLRAPEVVAAAIEKRSFLRAEAYQVSSCHMLMVLVVALSRKAQRNRCYALLYLRDSGQRPCLTVPKAMAASCCCLALQAVKQRCIPRICSLLAVQSCQAWLSDISCCPPKLCSGHCTLSILRLGFWQVSELPARAGRSPPPPSSCILPESRDSRFPSSSAGVGTGVSGQPGKAAALNRVATGQSVSERYWQMRATESQRVALGEHLPQPAHPTAF